MAVLSPIISIVTAFLHLLLKLDIVIRMTLAIPDRLLCHMNIVGNIAISLESAQFMPESPPVPMTLARESFGSYNTGPRVLRFL